MEAETANIPGATPTSTLLHNSKLYPSSLDSAYPFLQGWHTLESSINENSRTTSSTHTSELDQEARSDTTMLSALSFPALYTTPGFQIPLIDMWSDRPHSLLDDASNDLAEISIFSHMLALHATPESVAPPATKLVSVQSPDLLFHDTVRGPSRDTYMFPASNISPPAPSSFPKETTDVVTDAGRSPMVIYRPPTKKGSDRRCARRACAVNVNGMWIDKDDLSFGASQDNGIMSVHVCQWAISTNPCGMWIVGSRSRVGAHIRNWHIQRRPEGRVRCLWDGCNKTMLNDSVNRHILTAHLGEGFLCQGCDQVFPRKDVYNQHVKDDDECGDAQAEMVYGTESKVVDARRALQLGGNAVRYPGRY